MYQWHKFARESNVVSFTHDTRFNIANGKQSTFAEFNAEIVRDDGVCGRNRRRYRRVNADSRDNFASGVQ